MTPPFLRTTCACAECVQCCKDQPGPLIPGDMERIATHLGMTLDTVKHYFVASPGALVAAGSEVYRIGTITPRYENGRCVFLDANDRCSIHPVAPAGCSYFDTHMDMDEGQARGLWILRAQLDHDYQTLRSTLPVTTHYKPRTW